jgi:hypothetical protein
VHDTPQDDRDNAPFRWIRAPEAEELRKQRARTLSAFAFVVVVAATLSAEALLGRPYSHNITGHHVQNAFLRIPSSPPPIADPMESIASAPTERLTRHVPAIATAPTNMRALETKSITSREIRVPSQSKSSVAERKTRMTLASRKQANQSLLGPRVSKVATKSPPAPAHHDSGLDRKPPAKTASVAPAKSHEALRDFVLSSGWYALQVARNPKATY